MHAAPANQPVPAVLERVFLWRRRCADLCLLSAPMTAKTCSKCGTVKPLTEFYKRSSRKHGVYSCCKVCHNLANKANHHASKPKLKPSTDHLPNSKGCFKPAPLPHTAATGGPDWTPLKPSDLPQPVLRPGALDHEKHGSRQPDGSVKPYARPVCEPCYRQPQALQPRYSNN